MTQNDYPPPPPPQQQQPPNPYPPGQYPPPVYPGGYGFAPPEPERTSAAAIGSVIGALVLPLIGGLLGVVLGILGLIEAGKPGKKGKGLAITGIVLGVLHLMLIPAIVLPALGRVRAQANEIKAASNLRMIGNAFAADAEARRTGFAGSLDELAKAQGLPSIVLETPEGKAFVYVPPKDVPGYQQIRNPSTLVIAYSPPGALDSGAVVVLFADGHTEGFKGKDAALIAAMIQSGNTRPTTPKSIPQAQ
ncbi:MAG TPA: hypothetical protein VF796_05930 [Humisphaera sp.]